jgi:hypothetical protein
LPISLTSPTLYSWITHLHPHTIVPSKDMCPTWFIDQFSDFCSLS